MFVPGVGPCWLSVPGRCHHCALRAPTSETRPHDTAVHPSHSTNFTFHNIIKFCSYFGFPPPVCLRPPVALHETSGDERSTSLARKIPLLREQPLAAAPDRKAFAGTSRKNLPCNVGSGILPCIYVENALALRPVCSPMTLQRVGEQTRTHAGTSQADMPSSREPNHTPISLEHRFRGLD